jgi:hypothetical protein
MAMSFLTEKFERSGWFTMAVSCSRLGVVRPNSAFKGDGERPQLAPKKNSPKDAESLNSRKDAKKNRIQ